MKVKFKDLDVNADALELFKGLIDSNDNCFLLETLEDKDQPQSTSSSYIGVAPKNVYAAKSNKLYKNNQTVDKNNPYFALREVLNEIPGMPSGYFGGLVGYYSHEGMNYIERSIEFGYKREFPDFQFGEYEDGVIFDKNKQARYFYYQEDRSSLYSTRPEAYYKNLTIEHVGVNKDFSKYETMIESASEDIRNGRVFQVVLANKYSYEYSGQLLELYAELRAINPSPFMFFIKFGDYITLGASPELLAHTKPNRDVYLEALAGTVKRTGIDNNDAELAARLLQDEKEVAEHSMLVDLARNDVGRIAEIGSVNVENLMYIKKLSHVQHIASIVKGTLKPEYDMFDSLAASFPAGTLSGAPKIEAIKMIAELESTERGPYGGTIGYFGYNGDSMHAVNIRSVSAHKGKMYLHSGSGIVFDSNAKREYEEIHEKKKAMELAIGNFMKKSAS